MYPSQLPPGVSRWRSLTLNAEHEDVDLDVPPHVYSVYGDMYVCQESAVLERVERMLSFVVEEPDTPAHIRERATLALSEVRRRRQRVTQLIQMATEHQQRRPQSTRVKLSEPQHPGGEEPVTAEAAAWTITEAIKDLAKAVREQTEVLRESENTDEEEESP